jgi:hypothetical protein
MTNSDVSNTITQAKEAAQQGKTELLKTFEFVPDDKLTWSPSPSARTALWMVAHCGAANRAFATILRGEALPISDDPEEAAAQVRNGGRDVMSREAAVRLVEESTAEVLAALDTVTAERLASSPDTPLGPLPFSVWMAIPGQHMSGHTRQLEYLQTIWGDLEDHV